MNSSTHSWRSYLALWVVCLFSLNWIACGDSLSEGSGFQNSEKVVPQGPDLSEIRGGTDAGNPNNGGTDAGNPRTVKVDFAGTIGNGHGHGKPSIEEAAFVMGEMQYRPLIDGICPSAEEVDESENFGPVQLERDLVFVDVLRGIVLPDTEPSHLGEDQFCRLDLRFDVMSPSDIPEGLSPEHPVIGHALHIKGRMPNGALFIARLDRPVSFMIQRDEGFPIHATENMKYFLVYDVEKWFEGIDLSQFISSGLPVVLFDSTHNSEVFEKLIYNVQRSAMLFDDVNENGSFDDEDLSALIASGQPVN